MSTTIPCGRCGHAVSSHAAEGCHVILCHCGEFVSSALPGAGALPEEPTPFTEGDATTLLHLLADLDTFQRGGGWLPARETAGYYAQELRAFASRLSTAQATAERLEGENKTLREVLGMTGNAGIRIQQALEDAATALEKAGWWGDAEKARKALASSLPAPLPAPEG